MAGLPQMVERVRSRLNQYAVNRPVMATFNSLTGSSMSITPIQGYNTMGGSSLIEIGPELIQISSFDSASNTATVPSWGRGQMGTNVQATLTAGSRAIVNPLWPYWHCAEALIDAIRGLYPNLFQVKNLDITSTVMTEKYQVPNDVEDILSMRIRWQPGLDWEYSLTRFTLDVHAIDGNRYLYMPAIGQSGRTIHVTYRAQPTYPTAPDDTTWDFATCGFPKTAEDLPVLRACALLVADAEASRLQNYSAEQSDRARFIQAGSAVAASKRYDDMYKARLLEERTSMMDHFPPKLRRGFVG